MNFFKMLSPMRTKMLTYVTLLLFLLPSMEVMGQCEDLFAFSSNSFCDFKFEVLNPASGATYNWEINKEGEPAFFLDSGPIVSTNLAGYDIVTVTLIVINPDGTTSQCSQILVPNCCSVVSEGCISACFDIRCSEMLLVLEQGELPNGTYDICYMDGQENVEFTYPNNNPTEIPYTNINTVLNPDDHIIIKQNGVIICEFDLLFPEPGIFLGRPCQTEKLSDFITNGILPPAVVNGNAFPSVYLAGSMDADVNYTFQDINVFTGTGTEINIRPSLDANGDPSFTQIALFNDTYVGPQEECVCIWRGFQVFSNGFLSSNFSLFGPVPESRTTIEGAMYAIRTIHDDADLSTPVVVTINADLRRNFIGFRATDGPNFHAFIGTNFLGHDEDGNEFMQAQCSACNVLNDLEMNTANTNFPFQNHAYAGIFVDGVRGADGIDGAMLNMIPTTNINHFENLAVGILVDEANATIQGAEFENIRRFTYENNSGFGIRFIGGTNHTLEQVGSGKEINNFLNVEHGIFASSHGFGTIVNISQNNMDRVQFGINLTSPDDGSIGTIGNIADADITHNSITINENFGDTDNAQPPYGIGLFEMNMNESDYLIADNYVTVDIPLPTQSIGIWVEGMNEEGDDIIIRSNTVQLIDGQEGIRLDDWNAANVNNNLINIEDVGNNLPFGDPAAEFFDAGIRIQGGSDNIVSCNTVEGINTGIVADALLIDDTASGFINGNTLKATKTGLSVQNTSTGTQLVCNSMNGPMATGLLYGPDGMTGPQDNNGNTWNESFGIGAQHTGNFGASLFTVHSGNQNPPSTAPVTGWFSFVPFPTPSILCPSCQTVELNPPTPPVVLDDIDIRVLTEQLDGLPDAVKHLLNRLLFGKLKEFPNLTIGNPTAQQFLDTHENTVIGLLHQFEKNLKELYEIDAATKTVLENNKIDIQSALAEIRAIDILLASDPMSLLLHGERNNQLSIVKTKTAENKVIQDQLQTNRALEADDLLNDLEAMPATANYEVNEKNIYDIYVNTFVKGNPLTTSQNNLVETLAYSCTNVEGPAVHLARSIHSWRTKTPVNSQDCVMEATNNFVQNGNGTVIIDKGFSVYPNPTANNLTVQIPESYLEIPLTLTLVDITGKVSNKVTTTIGTTNFELEIAPLPNGIYFLKAYDQSEQVFSTKVIISK